MPFRVTPESFEILRPPSEVFADTMDLFSGVIVNSVMDKVSAMSDHELDAVDSNAEETPESDSQSSEELNTSPPTISMDALHCCICAILHKVQEMSGRWRTCSEKLHRSITEAVYAELLQRMRSKNQLIEAVKSQSELLTGSIAVSIIRAVKSVDPKDSYRPASVQSGSSASIKEEPLVSSPTIDNVMLPSQDSSRGYMSDRQHLASLTTWLVAQVLAQPETWVY
ncbi:hypothetical protein SRHO_G00310170 [Serrasalmus rhombeus]